MDTDLNDSPFLTVPEAAIMFKICHMSIYLLCKAGKIPHIRIGNRIKIPKDAIDIMFKRDNP